MKISTKGRYGLRLMVHLAQNKEKGAIPLKDIAVDEKVSLKYLEQIVSALSKQKMIYSLRGAKGGYSLVKEPKEYLVGDILECIEGNMCPVSCLEEGSRGCPRYQECTTIKLWEGLDKVIREYLNSYTLEDLIHGK